jgi:hypothetical protein
MNRLVNYAVILLAERAAINCDVPSMRFNSVHTVGNVCASILSQTVARLKRIVIGDVGPAHDQRDIGRRDRLSHVLPVTVMLDCRKLCSHVETPVEGRRSNREG